MKVSLISSRENKDRQYIDEQLALKQDVLTAGDNITISTETESDMR